MFQGKVHFIDGGGEKSLQKLQLEKSKLENTFQFFPAHWETVKALTA